MRIKEAEKIITENQRNILVALKVIDYFLLFYQGHNIKQRVIFSESNNSGNTYMYLNIDKLKNTDATMQVH